MSRLNKVKYGTILPTMLEAGRLIGISAAVVDHKIFDPQIEIPMGNDIYSLLDTRTDVIRRAGSPLPNALTAYRQFTDRGETRLFYAVGNDNRGDYYRKNTNATLGSPQISTAKPTGVWFGIYADNGEVVASQTYFGASEDVVVSESAVGEKSNTFFIADFYSARIPRIRAQSDRISDQVKDEGGAFILSLSGAASSSVSDSQLTEISSGIKAAPDIVFGNEKEFARMAKHTGYQSSRLVVTTLAERGSVVRFEDTQTYIPAFNVPSSLVKDEEGAGDSYMGTMLGLLQAKPFEQWTHSDVIKSAKSASFAASLMVQSYDVRLGDEQARLVREYYAGL